MGTRCSCVTCHLNLIWVHGGLLDPLAVGCEDKTEECDANEGTKVRSDAVPLGTSPRNDSMGWLSLVPRLFKGSEFRWGTMPEQSGGGLATAGDPLCCGTPVVWPWDSWGFVDCW